MPEFNPLAQRIVEVLSSYADEDKRTQLQDWLKEYGQPLHKNNEYDLYLKLSQSILAKINEHVTHERQQTVVDRYMAWLENPNAETKYELTKQRKRLQHNSWKIDNRNISNALWNVSKVAYTKTELFTAVECIMDATTFDEKTQEIISSITWDKAIKETLVEWGERHRLYKEQVNNAASPERIELLSFCLQQYQRILITPTFN